MDLQRGRKGQGAHWESWHCSRGSASGHSMLVVHTRAVLFPPAGKGLGYSNRLGKGFSKPLDFSQGIMDLQGAQWLPCLQFMLEGGDCAVEP